MAAPVPKSPPPHPAARPRGSPIPPAARPKFTAVQPKFTVVNGSFTGWNCADCGAMGGAPPSPGQVIPLSKTDPAARAISSSSGSSALPGSDVPVTCSSSFARVAPT